jgi:hypothetical protein
MDEGEKRLIATMVTGEKVHGKLTTEHAASSYGQLVFVDEDGNAYDNWQIEKIEEA